MMNKRTDQEIQEILDAQFRNPGTTSSINTDEEEIQTYKRLFDELASEPSNTFLSYSFAANVMRSVQKQDLTRREIRTFLLYGLGLFIMFCIVGGILSMAPNNALISLEKGFARFALPILLGLVGFGLIQWADYWFVKRARKR